MQHMEESEQHIIWQKEFTAEVKTLFNINGFTSVFTRKTDFEPTNNIWKKEDNCNDSLLHAHFQGTIEIKYQPITNNSILYLSISVRGDAEHSALHNVQQLYNVCEVQNIHSYVMRKECVYLLYIFFNEPMPIWIARGFAINLLKESQLMDADDSLICDKQPSFLINHPTILPFNGKAWANGESVFLNPETNFQEPYKDQLIILKSVQKTSIDDVRRIITELNYYEKLPLNKDLQKEFIKDNLAQFLFSVTGINKDDESFLELTENFSSSTYFSAKEIDQVYQRVKEIRENSNNCFFGVAARRENIQKRSDIFNIATINSVFLDIDPPNRNKSPEEQSAEAKALQEQFLLTCQANQISEPTYSVGSGYGYHLYYVLDKPLQVPSTEWQNVKSVLINLSGADKQARDVTRLMRLPFSTNFKDKDNPRKVAIELNTGNRFKLEDFAGLIKAHEKVHRQLPDIQLDDRSIKGNPPCIEHLLNPNTTIPMGHRHNVRFQCAVFGFKQGWSEIETINKLMHTTDEPQKCESDVKGVYKILTVNPERYRIGCGKGSLLRTLIDDGVTVCDKKNCQLYTDKSINNFQNDIFEKDNKYCRYKLNKKDQKIAETISSFIIQPLESISYENREHLNAKLVSDCGKEVSMILPPEVWLSKQRFLLILPGKEFVFVGTDRDIQLILNLISQKDFPSKKGYKRIGEHNINDKWTFITNTGAININGEVSDVVYLGDVNEFHTDILTVPPMLPQALIECGHSLISFNNPLVVAPILSWTVACFFKPRLFKINKSFPILSLAGERGSAKTVTVRTIILGLHGNVDAEKMVAQITGFTLMKLADASNALPLFIDEYKPSSLIDDKKTMISEYIRTAYNELQGDRGQADLSKRVFKYQAPTVIAGEDQFVEPALRERIIEVQLVKQETLKYQSNFQKLKEIDLKGLGRLNINKALSMTDEEVNALYQKEYQQISPMFEGKFRDNVAIIRFGAAILNQIFLEQTGYSFAITQYAEDSQKISLIDDQSSHQSVVDQTIAAIVGLIYESESNEKLNTNYQLVAETHYLVKGNELRINLNSVYQIFKKWAKDYYFEGDVLTKSGFLKQVKNQPYYVDHKRVQMKITTSRTLQCLILGMNELRANQIDTYDVEEGSFIRKQLERDAQYNTQQQYLT